MPPVTVWFCHKRIISQISQIGINLDIYTQKLVTADLVNGKILKKLMEGLNLEIESLSTGRVYKIWLTIWSLYGIATGRSRCYIDGKLSAKQISMSTPAYIYLPEEQTRSLCFFAVDREAFSRAKSILEKVLHAEATHRVPLTDRIPEEMEVESTSWVLRSSQRQILENYTGLKKMGDVVAESSSGKDIDELFSVTIWSEAALGKAKMHTVTFHAWSDEVKLQVELPEPEELFFGESEGGFVHRLAEVSPLFYSGDPIDIKKACTG